MGWERGGTANADLGRVPLLTALLSFIGKKIGSILQAIFGWSVTALFGRLPRNKEIGVTAALILSLSWPIFVVGLFFPGVAAWVVALLPLQEWLDDRALRMVWAALTFVTPLTIGLLVRWAAPRTKGGLPRAALAGYPLAVGLVLAFLITAVTVPIVKASSAVRRWSDVHVYVQARPGAYDRVLRHLAEACARAGILPRIEEPPTRMRLASIVLRFFAQAAVSPIVAERLLAIRAADLNLILYPADLLLRGPSERVARVRAMLTRTDIEADAYLVGSPRAQEIQDELARLVDVARAHEAAGQRPGRMLSVRLAEVWREMSTAALPYDEWLMLESIARRIERRIVTEELGRTLPLDAVPDELPKVAARANAPMDAPVSTPAWTPS